MAFCRFRRLAVILVALGLAAPAAAQFDPSFNHLKCYKIKDPAVVKTIVVDTQFGRERIVKLTPVLLCAPAKKTCCANPATVAGCQVIPCPADPVPATAVPHFKCNKIGVKQCTDAAGTAVDCTTLAKFAKNAIQVNLHDQFGDETVFVGGPKLLCAPVVKEVVGQTTTSTSTTLQTTTSTTSTTTTTRPPCRLEAFPLGPGMCAGDCPNPTDVCLNVPAGSNTCECVPQDQRCELGQPGACNGFCPGQAEVCQATTPPAGACDCCNLPGAPCAAHADCCSGSCLPSSTCN